MSGYVKSFDETKNISFLIKGDELLRKYYEIRQNFLKIFGSEPVYKQNI